MTEHAKCKMHVQKSRDLGNWALGLDHDQVFGDSKTGLQTQFAAQADLRLGLCHLRRRLYRLKA